jgi:hypothetical protein
MEGGKSSISIMGTVRVSSVKFRSIRLRALSASPAGRVPCYCCSPGGGSCGLWPWAAPVPCKIGRPHGSHICTQHNVHPSKTLLSKNMIYISKRHKNYICKQKKKLYRWRLTHLPSLLTRRHWYRWISGKVDPRIWVVLDSGDLP